MNIKLRNLVRQDEFATVAIGGICFLASALSTSVSASPFEDQPTGSLGVSLLAEPSVNLSPVLLRSFSTHSRLMVRADSSVKVSYKEVPGGFELLFKNLNLFDVGAPLGAEKEWLKQFKPLEDSRVSRVELSQSKNGVIVHGTWKFPSGRLALASPKMERFEFRQADPGFYVLDFWVKPGPTAIEAKIAAKKARDREVLRQVDEESKRRKAKREEVERARAELEDVKPFCRKPLDSSRDVFLAYQPEQEPFEMTRWFPLVTPDRAYKYLEPTGDSKDAQYARLALSLYQQGKPALAIRTIDFLVDEFPKSVYRSEMRFLRANAMVKLGDEESALRILAQIVAGSGQSPTAMNSALYLAKRSMEKSQYLVALETFLWLSRHYPTHRNAWLFHFGAAECLKNLRQTDRAAAEYELVAAKAPDRRSQAEAVIRIGDLYMMRQQYDQALASYYQVNARYPEEAKEFASIRINRAEALYWLGQYERAEQEFRGFLASFPGNSTGWRATLRLGEIIGRRAGDEARAESRKWFHQTVNAFPFTPGAVLARARLLPCEDHAGFNYETATRFFEGEAKAYTGGDQVFMANYREFIGLARIRTMIGMGQYDDGVDAAIAMLKSNPKGEARNIAANTLRALLRRTVLDRLAKGEKYEALQFYKARQADVPKARDESDFAEVDYLLRLAQAASDLGFGELAGQLTASHGEQMRKDAPARGIAAEDLDRNIERSVRAFTEAKALWVAEGMKNEPKIRELLAEVIEESEYSYEREVLYGLMAEKAGKLATARKHSLKAQLLMPKTGTADEQAIESARVDFWVAGLEGRVGDPRVAIETYKRLAELKLPASGTGIRMDATAVLGLKQLPSRERVLMAQGDLLGDRLGRWGEAAATYQMAVDAGLGGNQAMYEFSRALGKSPRASDREKSRQALERLAESDQDDFWRRLARQALATESGKYQPKKKAKEGE